MAALTVVIAGLLSAIAFASSCIAQ